MQIRRSTGTVQGTVRPNKYPDGYLPKQIPMSTKKCSLFHNKEVNLIPDNNYPTFEPAPFITMTNSGYLNGGYHVKTGEILKLIKVKKDKSGSYANEDAKVIYIYQGLRKLDRAEFGFVNFNDEDIVEKYIYGAEQFLRIGRGDWFRPSTREEIELLTNTIEKC